MPHSAIKFKNEKDYSFFSQTENIGNQSEFIELHLEKRVINLHFGWMLRSLKNFLLCFLIA
jgi:hypothetical protein